MSYSIDEIRLMLEEVLPESRKAIRVLLFFLSNPSEDFTKYMIMKNAVVEKIDKIIERFLRLGIILMVDEEPKTYRLNEENKYVQLFRRLLPD